MYWSMLTIFLLLSSHYAYTLYPLCVFGHAVLIVSINIFKWNSGQNIFWQLAQEKSNSYKKSFGWITGVGISLYYSHSDVRLKLLAFRCGNMKWGLMCSDHGNSKKKKSIWWMKYWVQIWILTGWGIKYLQWQLQSGWSGNTDFV